MRVIEKPFDVHFTDKQAAEKLANEFNGNVRNNSHRRYGQRQTKLTTKHYAVRIKADSFGQKIEIMGRAKQLGKVSDPWKH